MQMLFRDRAVGSHKREVARCIGDQPVDELYCVVFDDWVGGKILFSSTSMNKFPVTEGGLPFEREACVGRSMLLGRRNGRFRRVTRFP